MSKHEAAFADIEVRLSACEAASTALANSISEFVECVGEVLEAFSGPEVDPVSDLYAQARVIQLEEALKHIVEQQDADTAENRAILRSMGLRLEDEFDECE